MSAFVTVGVGSGVGEALSTIGEGVAEGERESAGVSNNEQPANILRMSTMEVPARRELFSLIDILFSFCAR